MTAEITQLWLLCCEFLPSPRRVNFVVNQPPYHSHLFGSSLLVKQDTAHVIGIWCWSCENYDRNWRSGSERTIKHLPWVLHPPWRNWSVDESDTKTQNFYLTNISRYVSDKYVVEPHKLP